ncbi:MAG: glycosyltransferase, partial [Chlamydiae bacterium]|nr:glycosyltransferase [Chlamydiota bacterium]
MKTICLNMIVKNEAHVIRRCLMAVRDHIDYWVIVDTGSDDETQEIIRECLRGYPGELHERGWVNFEHNRNEALAIARSKADYTLFVDADEIIHFLPSFDKNKLCKNIYFLKTIAKGQEFYFPKLIQNDPLWKWTGVLHESVYHPGEVDGDTCTNAWTESIQDGARSRDPAKNQRDIDILRAAIEKDPDDARYVFYLAQTHFTAHSFEEALKIYEKRAQMQGADDETFWSLFAIAQIEEYLGRPSEQYLKSYEKAYAFDCKRAEPLERMANYYLQNGRSLLAYALMKHAGTLPVPFPLSSGYYGWVYHFAIDSILADAALDLGRKKEARLIYEKILLKEQIPSVLENHAREELSKIDACERFPEAKYSI